jgi:hypothetical protein
MVRKRAWYLPKAYARRTEIIEKASPDIERACFVGTAMTQKPKERKLGLYIKQPKNKSLLNVEIVYVFSRMRLSTFETKFREEPSTYQNKTFINISPDTFKSSKDPYIYAYIERFPKGCNNYYFGCMKFRNYTFCHEDLIKKYGLQNLADELRERALVEML